MIDPNMFDNDAELEAAAIGAGNNEIQPCEDAYAEQPYDGGGWAGDGSGVDDFEDMNQNEADDYRDEGAEDSYLDAFWEDRCECDYGDY